MTSNTNQQVRTAGRRRDPVIDETILKAALELFLEQGVEGANFEQISKRTGISRATIYRRWSNRADLLNAALWSAKAPGTQKQKAILDKPPQEFLGFIEDMLVGILMNPKAPKLVAQLIGSLASHPDLLANYRNRYVEPAWRLISEAIAKAWIAGAIETVPDPALVRDMLAGAAIHRLISRIEQPMEDTERTWAKRLMRQTGLVSRLK